MATRTAKKTSLSDRLRQQQEKATPEAPALAIPRPAKTATQKAQYKAPTRIGKRQLALYVDPPVLKQLKMIALDEDKTQHDILIEALNDLFAKKGKPRIA
jgi:hypothetical protein